MKNLRKVVVAGYEFAYEYHFDCYGYAEPSYVRAVLSDDDEAEVIIYFHRIDSPEKKYPLNKGIPARKDGEDVILSLNRVPVVSDILMYLLMSEVDFVGQKKYCFQLGEEILRGAGYSWAS